MTVTVDSRRREYSGNGVATSFNGPMAYQPQDVQVFLTVGGVTSQVSPGEYEIDRFGRASGTRVVMNTPPPSGSNLLLLRTVPYSQDVDITNQGAFHAETIEKGFDALAMQTQQLADGLSFSVQLREDYPIPRPDLRLPDPEASRLIGWNVAGDALRNVDPTGPGDMLLRSDLADPTGGAGLVAMPDGGTVADIPAQRVGSANFSYRIGVRGLGEIDDSAAGSLLFAGRSGWDNKLGVNNTKPRTEATIVSRTNDTGYTPGVASVAGILAGYDNVNNALAGMIASQHSMLYTGADHASIFGGSLHTCYPDTRYSVIVGGTDCAIEPMCRNTAIIGSESCKAETGADFNTSGFRSFIGGSTLSIAGGRNATILGGLAVNIQTQYSAVIGGQNVNMLGTGQHLFAHGNTINFGAGGATSYSAGFGLNITIDGGNSLAFGSGITVGVGHILCSAIGTGLITPFMGSHVRSSRQRGNVAGRNQSLDFTCSQESTGVALTSLSLAGGSNYPRQPENSIVHGAAYITGVDTATGNCSTYRIDFTSRRIGAANPVMLASTVTDIYNGLSLPTPPTIGVAVGGIYRVQVTGLASTNIAWDARVVAQQVVFTP